MNFSTGNTGNIIVDLLIAVLVYFLFNIVIDTFVKDASANQIFKIILLIICLAIVFIPGFFHIG